MIELDTSFAMGRDHVPARVLASAPVGHLVTAARTVWTPRPSVIVAVIRRTLARPGIPDGMKAASRTAGDRALDNRMPPGLSPRGDAPSPRASIVGSRTALNECGVDIHR
jgi:hypothetical protein